MKSKIILFASFAVTAMAFSCGKQETDSSLDEIQTEKPASGEITLSAVAADTKANVGSDGLVTWSETDKIAVWSTGGSFSEFTLSDGAGETNAHFTGNIPDGTPSTVAVYPSSIAASLSGTTLGINLPAEIAWSEACQPPMVAVFSDNGEKPLSFRHLGGIIRIEYNKVPLIARSLQLCSNNKNISGAFEIDLSSEIPVMAASGSGSSVTVTFENPETDMVFFIPVPVGEYDNYTVCLRDAAGDPIPGTVKSVTKNSSRILRADLLQMPVINTGLQLKWGFGDFGVQAQFQGHFPAIDKDGNIYVTVPGTTELWKFSNNGEVLWKKDIGFTGKQNTSPAVEADGSVIYAMGGDGGNGAVRAFNADGTTKWSFDKSKFFATGTPAPNFNFAFPAVGDNNIYVGNAGTTGSVVTISKATGERVSYVSGKADGSGGPAGGVAAGVYVSKGGTVSFENNYGLFVADKDKMDVPEKTHSTYGNYTVYGLRFGYNWNSGQPWKYWNNHQKSGTSHRAGAVCFSYGGTNYICYTGNEATGTANTNESNNLRVLCIADTYAKNENAPGLNVNNKFYEYVLRGVKYQDQGGIVTGDNAEVIVAMKKQSSDGGLIAVGPDGQLKWRFNINADVTGAAAVDDNGYIHCVSDWPAVYYILRVDGNGNVEKVIEQNLFDLIKEKYPDMSSSYSLARCWTSIKMAEDGAIVLALDLYDTNNTQHGYLASFMWPGTNGYSQKSSWPQKQADAGNRGVQLR